MKSPPIVYLDRFHNLVAGTQLADRLGVQKIQPGFRVWADAQEAGFLVETDAGLAKVTVEVMQVNDEQARRRWEEIAGQAVRKKRAPIYDLETVARTMARSAMSKFDSLVIQGDPPT